MICFIKIVPILDLDVVYRTYVTPGRSSMQPLSKFTTVILHA